MPLLLLLLLLERGRDKGMEGPIRLRIAFDEDGPPLMSNLRSLLRWLEKLNDYAVLGEVPGTQ